MIAITNEGSILGCFVSTSRYPGADEKTIKILEEKWTLFRGYIWGEFGISNLLAGLRRMDYVKDLELALCKFYVLPLLEELAVLKEIERFRPNEKAIGLPIIVHDENFFNKSEIERRTFLRESILEKLELLVLVIKRNKLDTDIEKLKSDVEKILS